MSDTRMTATVHTNRHSLMTAAVGSEFAWIELKDKQGSTVLTIHTDGIGSVATQLYQLHKLVSDCVLSIEQAQQAETVS